MITMLKTLVKKQLSELAALYFPTSKKGKVRSKATMTAIIALFFLLFGTVGVAFYWMLDMLAAGLTAIGLDWLYFALAAVTAIMLGTFGSAFSTYAGLYHAKDNEALLAMPIKPMYILTARMVSVMVTSFFYAALVWIPALIRYAVTDGATALSLISSIVMTPLITATVTVISCALGWLVALISGKLKNKSFITVIISLVLIGGYYFLSSKLTTFIENIVANGEAVGDAIKKWAYPIYQIGMGSTGDIVGLLITLGITAALCVLCAAVLSRGFIKIVTTNTGIKKAVYKESSEKAASPSKALWRRELRRFASSPTYMLNCGIGLVFLPAVTVMLFLKGDLLANLQNQLAAVFPEAAGFIPVLLAAALCLMASTFTMTAPSVSLEGKNIWIVRSMPVSTEKTLMAKVRAHLTVGLPPVAICSALCGIAVGADALATVMITVLSSVFTVFTALTGLWFNLVKPNLSWTSEVVPIKQGASVCITLFGGWAVAVAIGGIYFLASQIEAWLYLLLCSAAVIAVCVVLGRLIKTKGREMFESL